MPFADRGGAITGGLQRLCDGDFFERKLLLGYRREQLGVGKMVRPGQEVGDAEARGILAGHDAGARRRTDRTSRVRIGESHALRRQFVDVGSLEKLAAVIADVAPPHVVDEDEDEIERRPFLRAKQRCGGQGREERRRESIEEFYNSLIN